MVIGILFSLEKTFTKNKGVAADNKLGLSTCGIHIWLEPGVIHSTPEVGRELEQKLLSYEKLKKEGERTWEKLIVYINLNHQNIL